MCLRLRWFWGVVQTSTFLLISPFKPRLGEPQVSHPLCCGSHNEDVESAQFLLFCLFCVPYSVFAGGRISVSAKPNIHSLYRVSVWCVCELACLFMHQYEMSLYCLCRKLEQWLFWSFLRPLSLNTLSCRDQLWQDLWAPVIYEPPFHSIGILFWFGPIWWHVFFPFPFVCHIGFNVSMPVIGSGLRRYAF